MHEDVAVLRLCWEQRHRRWIEVVQFYVSVQFLSQSMGLGRDLDSVLQLNQEGHPGFSRDCRSTIPFAIGVRFNVRHCICISLWHLSVLWQELKYRHEITIAAWSRESFEANCPHGTTENS